MAGLKNKWYLFLLILSFIVVFSKSGTAQWSSSFSLDQEYNSNPFRIPEAEASWISNLYGKLQYDWQNYSMRYYGSFVKFDQTAQRNFYWHQVAFWGGTDTLNYGAYIEQRVDREDYNIYDYNSSSAYFNYRFYIGGLSLLSTNNIYLNQYAQLSQLNNWQLGSKLQFQKSFQTKTTMIGGVGLYVKRYMPLESTYYITGVDTVYSEAPVYGGGRGHGRGSYMTPVYEYQPSETPSLTQFIYWLRISQSITPTTGLAFQLQKRSLWQGFDRYISGLAYDYSSESQIFDDPMGYESLTIGSELTKLLPAGFLFKMAYYVTDKNYISQGIYTDADNFDEQTLRSDRYKTAWLSLGKTIFTTKTGDRNLRLSFDLQWIKNQSNSYWYDYQNKNSSLGLQFSF